MTHLLWNLKSVPHCGNTIFKAHLLLNFKMYLNYSMTKKITLLSVIKTFIYYMQAFKKQHNFCNFFLVILNYVRCLKINE